MVERLRALAERPLDPRAALAATVLATAIFAGLAVLVLLAGSEQGSVPRARRAPIVGSVPAAPLSSTLPPRTASSARPRAAHTDRRRHPAQDPQDRRGSAAAQRAARELAGHLALQHIPYRGGAVAIDLVGAIGHRAILRVSAPTLMIARRDWRAFLDRYHDSGRSYLPRFHLGGGNRG